MFDLKLGEVAAWIRGGGYHSVALQLPEGLKRDAAGIVDFLSENTDSSFVVLGDPCYGACDVFIRYKEMADALVHFGHSRMPSIDCGEDVYFAEVRWDGDIREHLRSIADDFEDRIGLLATIQYIGCLEQAKSVFSECGKKTVVGIGDGRITYPGQVLGCNCSAAENIADDVDEFLFIGEGDFHPLAAAFGVKKKIRVLNPITGELRSIDEIKERIMRRRFGAIQSASDAGTFLVIVSPKAGQKREELADSVVSMITDAGKKAYKVSIDEISPQSLMPYKADAYISTACPRIAIDDSARYAKPMLTPIEAEIAVGVRGWGDYAFDAIRP